MRGVYKVALLFLGAVLVLASANDYDQDSLVPSEEHGRRILREYVRLFKLVEIDEYWEKVYEDTTAFAQSYIDETKHFNAFHIDHGIFNIYNNKDQRYNPELMLNWTTSLLNVSLTQFYWLYCPGQTKSDFAENISDLSWISGPIKDFTVKSKKIYEILHKATLLLLDPSLNEVWQEVSDWMQRSIIGILVDHTLIYHPYNILQNDIKVPRDRKYLEFFYPNVASYSRALLVTAYKNREKKYEYLESKTREAVLLDMVKNGIPRKVDKVELP